MVDIFTQHRDEINRLGNIQFTYDDSFSAQLKADLEGINKLKTELASGVAFSQDVAQRNLTNGSKSAFTFVNQDAFLNFDNEEAINEYEASQRRLYIATQATNDSLENCAALIDGYNQAVRKADGSQQLFIEGVSQSNKQLGKYLSGLNGAEGSLKGYQQALTTATMQAVALQIKTVALNLMISALASAIVSGVVWAFDQMITTSEEAAEAMETAFSEYDTAKQKVADVNSELDTTNDRIAELQAKGGLTFVEQSELEKLRESKELLEQQAKIAIWESDKKAREAANSAIDKYKKDGYSAVSQEEIESRYWNAKNVDGIGTLGVLATSGDLNASIAYYRMLVEHQREQYEDVKTLLGKPLETLSRSERNDVLAYRDVEEYLAYAEENLQLHIAALSKYQQDLLSIPEELRTGEQNQYLKEIEDSIEFMWKTLDADEWNQMQFDSFFDTENLNRFKDALIEIAKAKNGITKDDLDRYGLLVGEVKQAGFTTDDLVEYINSQADTVDLVDATNQLKDRVASQIISSVNEAVTNEDVDAVAGIEIQPKLTPVDFNNWYDELDEKEKLIVVDWVLKGNVDVSQFSVEELQEKLDTQLAGAKISFDELISDDSDDGFSNQIDKYLDDVDSLNEALEKINSGEFEFADFRELTDKFPVLSSRAGDLDLAINELLGSMNSDIVALFNEQFNNMDTEESRDQLRKYFDTILDFKGVAGGTVVSISVETENIDKVTKALEESLSGSGLSSESIHNIEELYSGLSGYNPIELFEKTEHGIHLNTNALQQLQKEYDQLNIKRIENRLSDLQEKYKKVDDELQNCTLSAEEYNKKLAEKNRLADQINEVANLASQYDGLTSAYNRWLNAQDHSERDMYEGVIKGKEEIEEEMSRGWFDEGTKSFIEMMSGQDLAGKSFDAYADAWRGLSKTIDGTDFSVFDFFTVDKDGKATSEGIFNLFDAIIQKQEEIGENGEKWAWIDEEGYHFDFGVGDDQKVAEALNMSVETLQMLLRAAKDAGGFDIQIDTPESKLVAFEDKAADVNDRLKELGATEYTFNINSTDLEDLDAQIAEAKTALYNLTNEDGSLKVGVSEADYQNAQTLLATLILQKQQLDESVVLGVNTVDAGEGSIESVVQKLQDFKTKYNTLEVTSALGMDTEGAQKELDTTIAALQTTDPEVLSKLGIDPTKSADEINSAITAIEESQLVELKIQLQPFTGSYDGLTDGEVVWDNNIEKVTAWAGESGKADRTAEGSVNWENGDSTQIDTFFSTPRSLTVNYDIGEQEKPSDQNVSVNYDFGKQDPPENLSAYVEYMLGEQEDPDIRQAFVDYILGEQTPPEYKEALVDYLLGEQALPEYKSAFVDYLLGDQVSPEIKSTLVNYLLGEQMSPQYKEALVDYIIGEQVSPVDMSALVDYLLGIQDEAKDDTAFVNYILGTQEKPVDLDVGSTGDIQPGNSVQEQSALNVDDSTTQLSVRIDIPEADIARKAEIVRQEIVKLATEAFNGGEIISIDSFWENVDVSGLDPNDLAEWLGIDVETLNQQIQNALDGNDSSIEIPLSAGVSNVNDELDIALLKLTQFEDQQQQLGQQEALEFGISINDGEFITVQEAYDALIEKKNNLTSPIEEDVEIVYSVNDDAAQQYKVEPLEGEIKYTPDFVKAKNAEPPVLHGKIVYSGVQRNQIAYAQVDGTAHNNGIAFAKGNWGTTDSGGALGGEIGFETLVRDGKYYTIGEHGAEFFQYKRGDIIFNHEQSKELFKYGRVISGGGHGRSYAQGNAFSNGSVPFRDTITSLVNKATGGKTVASNNNSSNSDSQSADDFKETFDWIEVAIDRIERAIDTLDLKASSVYRAWTERNKNLADEMSKIAEEIDIQQKGYERYLQEANSVGLEESWAKLVREGAIDIDHITDEALAERISQYTEWYNKALDCRDAVDDLEETLRECYQTAFDNVVTQYEGILSVIDHEKDILDEYMSQAENLGYLTSSKYYDALMEQEQKNIEQLRKEKAELEAALNTAVSSGAIVEGSEAYYDMLGEINDVTLSIEEAHTALIEYGNSIRDLEWEIFDLLQEKISNVANETEFLISLLENSDLYDDRGQFNNKGMAVAGLHGMNYDMYMDQADRYADEMRRIEEQLVNSPYDQALIERKQELLELQQESIQAAESEKQAIVDMVEEGVNLELEALEELIDKYKEALESNKDLYDTSKKMKEQTAEIAALEKQMAAYQGDTSEESKAKIQEIKASLEEARENLEETEYDQYIEDQEEILDKLYEEYEEILNNRLDNVDALIQDMILAINENSSTIDTALREAADKVGYDLTDAIKSTWNTSSGLDAITLYNGEIANSISDSATTISGVLNRIYNTVQDIVSASDNDAANRIGSYASGAYKIKKNELAWTQEERNLEAIIRPSDGAILTPLKQGDAVLNANATANMFDFANNPAEFIREHMKNNAAIANVVTHGTGGNTYDNEFNIQIALPNVTNYEQFKRAMQNDKSFEQMIRAMTVDRMFGGSALKKYRY